MEFRILGGLEVVDDAGRQLPLGGPREQRVLATLLLERGHVVSVDRLVDAVWDSDPPATGTKQVRNMISRLRVLFSGGRKEFINAVGNGYRLSVAEAELDASRFDALTARAARAAAAGDVAGAVEELRAALALWRGPTLAGLTGRTIRTAATAWDERRLATQEAYIGHELELGRHQSVVPMLTALVSEQPLRQRPVGQLMTALHLGGRRPEALALYRTTRELLARELGLDPDPELSDLHEQILVGGTREARPGTAAPAARARTAALPGITLAVPRQLPSGVPHFVGRVAELAMLTDLLDSSTGTDGARRAAGTVIVSSIDGTAGVGKTVLAVHWAHRVSNRFPDGQLYANLRGFDSVRSPLAPMEILRGFLDALGVPPARIPMAVDAQVGLYRSLTAERRMLIMLDNAGDADQVRPLLPGQGPCFVLVTTRRRLTGLIAAEGARPVPLDLFGRAEARELLAVRLGVRRVRNDPEAVDTLIDLCARLPLALNIAVAHAGNYPDLPLGVLAAQLRSGRNPLDALDSADPATSLRGVFSWSYRSLDEDAARMFRRLGLHPGPDMSLSAAAALAGLPVDEAARPLGELLRAHLITELTPGRYAFHDLLAAYAGEEARARETEADRSAALTRLFDHYLAVAGQAAGLLDPSRPATGVEVRPAGLAGADHITNHEQALAWFDAEAAALMASVFRAHEAGLDTHAWQLPWALTTYFDRRGRWKDLAAALAVALASAERSGDDTGRARAERGLGNCAVQLGDYAGAERRFSTAVDVYRQLGDLSGQASAFNGRSWAAARDHRHDDALALADQALRLYREAGNQIGAANALNSVGWQYAKLGDHRRAIEVCEQALPLQRELDDHQGAAATLDTIGFARHHLGDHQSAIAAYREALDLRQRLGDRYSRAATLTRLGEAHLTAQDPNSARRMWREALVVLDELGHPDADQVRESLRELGETV